MKKFFTISIIILLILSMATSVFAVAPTMEIVEDNVCKIDLNDASTFEKKIVASNLENHQVTLQLSLTNNSKAIIPSGELMLVIDSSQSMDTAVGSTTRKDLVLNSANTLVEALLKANSSNLKIGVVTFSTSNVTDPTTGFITTGTEADAQNVCELSNNIETLKSKISAIKGTGQYTNLDSGLQLAKKSFTSEDNNKYIIVLTDGLPNIAIGHNDLVTYNGLTDVINKTKATLLSLSDYHVITMLTGITNVDASFRKEGDKIYTYGQVIEQVFGSEAKPTVGKFYNVSDSQIESTITDSIYRDLLPITQSLKNITVEDFFPKYIVDNFDMTYVDGFDTSKISPNIDATTNSILWNIDELEAGKTATVQYNLTLKDTFDESIIGKILDTNENVKINFTDFDNTNKEKSSPVTPKIRLVPVQVDDTVAPAPLPEAGSHLILAGFVALVGISIFFGIKSRKIQ
ncbi:MAG: VWA domain-containing protein [Clostridia bacterium]|nr:VWA domain-containing protein [Clostridia bacterium]